MEIKGIVKKVLPAQRFSEKFRKQEFWFETEDTYPQILSIELINDNIDKFKLKEGKRYGVHINLRGRLWEGKDGARVFNSITAWKVYELKKESVEYTIPTIAETEQFGTSETIINETGQEVDDLPF